MDQHALEACEDGRLFAQTIQNDARSEDYSLLGSQNITLVEEQLAVDIIEHRGGRLTQAGKPCKLFFSIQSVRMYSLFPALFVIA